METANADISSGIENAQDDSIISWSVWGNDLILNKIATYLSTTDLKQLSCVDKFLLQCVRTLYRFTSLASQEVTGKMQIHVFKLSRAIVKVNTLKYPITLGRLAPKIFQETQCLELQGLDNLSDEQRNFRLVQIVSNCPKLKSLKLETLKILKDHNGSFLRNENVKTIITNLKELQIGPTLMNYELKCKDVNENCTKGKSQPTFTYELFEEITKNMKLVIFTYTESSISRDCYNPQLLININRETLTELKLAIEYHELESLNEIKFSKLRKLELAVFYYHSEGTHSAQMQKLRGTGNFPYEVLPFLGTHLFNLTEFHFGANYVCSLGPLCELLAELSFTEKLKVLCFSSYFGFQKPLSDLDWRFLLLLPLREFKFNYVHPSIFPWNNDAYHHFLYVLPSSTIKSIEFRGFNYRGFHEDKYYKDVYIFVFSHLSVLKIDSVSFIDDAKFQVLCLALRRLKILEVDMTNVTIFGISGIRKLKNPTGISLANLKNLVELEIYSRSHDLKFSIDELLKFVRFSHLVKFVVRSVKISTTPRCLNGGQLLLLLNRNPCLEYLDLWSIVPPWHIREKVLKLHPRFNWRWDYSCELERFRK